MTQIKNRKSLSQGTTYYDDYEKTGYWNKTAKDYQSVLFRSGKPLQSRELNFLQSLMHDKLKNSNDIDFRNGSVVEGCGVEFNIISTTNSDDTITKSLSVKVNDGIVYWDGTFFDFFEKEVSLIEDNSTDSKTFTANWLSSPKYPLYVYLAAKYETINSSVDPDLNDPAIQYKFNEKISGADRLKISFDIICSTKSDIYGKNGNINQWIPIAIISSKESVTLINRNARLEFDDEILESKVLQGLRIKNNPMREAFMITDDNKNYYRKDNGVGKEYSFVEIEAGSCLINGEKVSSMESKVLNFDKGLSSVNSEMLNTTETHKFDVGKDLRGCFWFDIAHPDVDDDTFDMMYDGFLNKGQKVKIKMRIPICVGMTEDNKGIYEYVVFDIGEAEIADVYNLQNDQEYDTTITDDSTAAGTSPIFPRPNPISIPGFGNISTSLDMMNEKLYIGMINSSINKSNKIVGTATNPSDE